MKVITVGRSQECNIVVNDEKASRVHLQLVQDDNGNVSVVDLGSTNGTWVNDNRIAGEMRLNQGDRIRVGNTLLQWQNYFSAKTGDEELTANVDKDAAPFHGKQPPKPNRTLMWVIIAAVAALIVAGGVIWILHEQRVKNSEKEAAERNAKERAEQSEMEMAVAEAEAKSDYNTALREAVEKEKNNALDEKESAIRAMEEAEKAKKKAMQDKETFNKQKEDAIAAKKKAETEKEKANEERDMANYRKNQAETARDNAIKKALQNSINAENAEKKAKLTEDFYSQLNKANKDGKLKEVCEALKIDTKKYKKSEEQYDRIAGKFRVAKDNDARESIINSIKNALREKNKPSKKTTETSTPKSVETDSAQVEKKE